MPRTPISVTRRTVTSSRITSIILIRGRCELVLNDNRYVFLTSGQISLTERYAQSEYMYPGREYEGIELFIDPDTAAGEDSMLKSGFGLDVTELRDKYCPDGETVIAGMHLPDALREKLWEQGSGREVQDGMKTGVIELLAALIYETAEMKTARPVYYTKSQVGIAKRTEEIITADLSKQHTVREFAELFSVSESSVKNYFCGVFGQSKFTAMSRISGCFTRRSCFPGRGYR